ncbi:reductase [Xylogone sp. PMI_703]|nr:reductase [Xylogone sp. PMI_703]
MAGNLVLLTGATGFVGIRVLEIALERGYRVRCAIRAEAGIKKIREATGIKKLAPTPEQLSFIIVPDITAPNAYDEAVKGVQYIIHVASPMTSSRDPQKTDDEAFIQPAVQGAVGILNSALSHANSTLKRAVITSSIMAIIPPEYFAGRGDPSKLPFDAESRIPNLPQPYSPGLGAYQASKVAALNAIESWQNERAPPFDIVSPMPSLIIGHDGLATTPAELSKGGNAFLLNALKGNKALFPLNSSVADVNDVALAHVQALNPDILGNQGFIVGEDGKWDEVTNIVKSSFPEAFLDGTFQEGGEQPAFDVPLDTRKTKQVLGIQPIPFEKTVIAVAKQYIQLSKGGQ